MEPDPRTIKSSLPPDQRIQRQGQGITAGMAGAGSGREAGRQAQIRGLNVPAYAIRGYTTGTQKIVTKKAARVMNQLNLI